MAEETAPKQPRKPRKARSEVTSEEAAEQRARTDWTRDKLDMLQAAIHDPRLKGGPCRFVSYILQCTNYRTRVAIVHDQQIMDELPGYGDDETIRRTRKLISAIGWFDVVPGRGTRASVYTPRADNIEGVMSLIRHKAEARRENHAYRKEALRTGEETLQQQHQTTNEMRGKRVGRSPQNAGEFPFRNEGITPSLSPSGSRATRTRQDVELQLAALSHPVEVWCHVCGTPADAWGRALPDKTLRPWCAECEDGLLLDDRTAIPPPDPTKRPAQMSYAEASRGI